MKYKKLLIVALALSLMACNQSQNTTINDQENEPVQQEENQTPEVEETVTEEEAVVEEIYLVPMLKMSDNKELWGYVKNDALDTPVIDFQYDKAEFFNDKYGFAIVYKDGEAGVIDKSGALIMDFGKYKVLHEVSGDLLYGQTIENEPVILDYKGQEYAKYDSTDYIYNRGGVLDIYSDDQSYYFDPITKQAILLDKEMNYEYEEVFFSAVDKPIDVAYDEINGRYYVSRGGKSLSEEGFDYVLPIDDFIIVGVKDEQIEKFTGQPYGYGLIDEKGNIIIDSLYYDIKHLSDEYFSVAQAYDYRGTDYKRYSEHVYKKAIFSRTKAVSGFDYYILEHVKESIFYVYDGENYYFIDVSTGEEMLIKGIEGPLEFRTVGDLIIAEFSGYEGRVIYYIQDWVIKKRSTHMTHLTDGLVLHKFKAAGISPIFYPVVALESGDAEKKINNDLEKKFETYMPPEGEGEVYSNISSIGFYAFEYNNVLQISQTSYWYEIGTAHGNYGETTFLYDLLTGDQIQLDDLFKEEVDYHKVLAMSMAEQSEIDNRLYVDITTMTDEEIVEYFKRESYNFKLTEEGLLIYYNPYDIGPYAAGIVDFVIPYDSLTEVLKDELPWLKNE